MIRFHLAPVLSPVLAFSLAIAVTPLRAEIAPTTRVAYADLDLSTPAGMAMLEHRVNGAISAVCGDMSPTDLHAMRLTKDCRKTARCDAETRVAMAVQAQQFARADAGATKLAAR